MPRLAPPQSWRHSVEFDALCGLGPLHCREQAAWWNVSGKVVLRKLDPVPYSSLPLLVYHWRYPSTHFPQALKPHAENSRVHPHVVDQLCSSRAEARRNCSGQHLIKRRPRTHQMELPAASSPLSFRFDSVDNTRAGPKNMPFFPAA